MSRGPGRVQRAVLAYFTEPITGKFGQSWRDLEHWESIYQIALSITKDEIVQETGKEPEWYERIYPSLSCVESVRRAVKTLAAAGRLETTQLWGYDDDGRPSIDRGLHCRLSAAERLATEEYRLSVGKLPTLSAAEVVELLNKALSGSIA
jgi:hypothetical protein